MIYTADALTETVFFDNEADSYVETLMKSIKIFGETPEYFADYKVRALQERLSVFPPGPIVDFGCGIGLITTVLGRTFPERRVIGYDISRRSITVAEEMLHPSNVRYTTESISGAALVFMSNVLHHVDPCHRSKLLQRVRKSLLPGGVLVVVEHNPINPLTRMVVKRSPLDDGATLLFAWETISLLKETGYSSPKQYYITFFPHFLLSMRKTERYLTWCPFGAQYMVIASKYFLDY